MSEQIHVPRQAESKRRLWLRVLTKCMLLVTVLMGLWVTLSPLFRSDVPANHKAVETLIDVSEMAPAEVRIVEWFDKPLIIVRRSAELEAELQAVPVAALADADNTRSLQPPAADKPLRSATAGWFVAIGLGTSTGCALQYDKPQARFADGCDGSRYDLAGRALAGAGAARKNIPVPYWRFDNGRLSVSTKPVQ